MLLNSLLSIEYFIIILLSNRIRDLNEKFKRRFIPKSNLSKTDFTREILLMMIKFTAKESAISVN